MAGSPAPSAKPVVPPDEPVVAVRSLSDGEGKKRAIRTALMVGPLLACLGVAWTVVRPSYASQAAVLIGLLTCLWATHRFGRLGPE